MKKNIYQLLVHLNTLAFRLLGSYAQNRFIKILNEATTNLKNGVIARVTETIPTKRGDIQFYCLDELPLWRARTLLTKEPETIEWIDTFSENDTFWDIGANIGIYSLYAGIAKNIHVLAFEPSSSNYILINRNIEINKLSESMKAYCLAFSNTTSLNELKMQNTSFGGALSSFAVPIDHDGNTFEPKFLQGMVGFSIDFFISTFSPSFPNHIKIDVDGIEDQIVHGAANTFADLRLKSLSIELDESRPDYTNKVIKNIERAGLTLKSQRHASMFDESPYSGIFNYLFTRK